MDRMKAFREITRAVGSLNHIAAEIRDNDDADHDGLIQHAVSIAAELAEKIAGEAK